MKVKNPIYPYKFKNVKPASKRGIQKVSKKNLRDFSSALVFFKVLTTPFGFVAGFKMIFVSAFKFFLPQYLQVIHLKHIPVKHVDHELDQTIPYKPEYISVYLDFVHFWLRPLTMLTTRYGWWNGSKHACEFLGYITQSYSDAYDLYKKCFTTTCRPKEKNNKALRKTQKADPHFMCVPSLHICVCVLTIRFYKMFFEREHFTQEETEKWNKELYADGMEIAESVLYLKQHSVNCIPAAMYMMSKQFPVLFSPEVAVEFADHFLSDASDISKENIDKIHEHLLFTYERFLLEGLQCDSWTEPILNWLNTYTPYTN